MKKRFKMTQMIASLLTGVVLVGCAGGTGGGAVQAGGDAPAAQTVTWRFAGFYPQNMHNSRSMTLFADYINERSDTLQIQTFYNAILGSELELGESVVAGTIEMVQVGTSFQAFLPNVQFNETPFLFHGYDDAHLIMNDPRYFDLIMRGWEDLGVIPVRIDPNGFRVISSRFPAYSMADLEGLRLRVPNIPQFLQMADALGTAFIALPLPEVFTALEQGVADAQENFLFNTYASGFYELQNYIIETNHMLSTSTWMINADAYNALSPQDQQLISEAAALANEYVWQALRGGLTDIIDHMEASGITFITPDDSFSSDMREAMVDVWGWYHEVNPDAAELFELVEYIRAGN